MLVLSRKADQEIVIGDNIRITVLKTKGNTVRLGISAPRDVSVMRGELETFRGDTTDSSPDGSQSAEANFTLVFDSDDEIIRTSRKLDVANGSRKSWQSSSRKPQTEPAKMAEHGSPDAQAISFRGKLPKALQRNRLQEIAAQISSDSSKPR